MQYIITFNLSDTEEVSYEKVCKILEKEFSLTQYDHQGSRDVHTPQTTLIGNIKDFKDSKNLAEAIRDRLIELDIFLDKILVCRTNDYTLIG